MELMKRYQQAVEELLEKVRNTQTENIVKAGNLIANSVANGGKIILSGICHSIENDLIYRGGGPIFYKHYEENVHRNTLKKGDVLVVSSVSGRTKPVVDLAWEMVEKGVNVIAFTSMEYAVQVDAVHESGKKLYEFATLTLDNCAPAAEAMLEVEGIEARFAAASGIASDYIMWNVTSVAVEKLLEMGITPGILKSANFPGGNDYNKTVIEPNFEKYGY
ncbi:MAG: SIS domain-containing protein [Clostridia bacterium]|nr:SIS domain-containing protein [Clostridia bacterium]